MMTRNSDIKYDIRWLIKHDMPEVLAIEGESYVQPWAEDDFLHCLRQRNCIGMVAEDGDGRIVGYVVYELHRGRLEVMNLAVTPPLRRNGIAAQIITKLIGKLSSHQRERITLILRESNLIAQLFFRSAGFAAKSVIRKYFDDTGEDAYAMEYRLAEAGSTGLGRLVTGRHSR